MSTFRENYIKEYRDIGKTMFKKCEIPTVYDFALAFEHNNEDALNKIKTITDFTDNYDDIEESCQRRYPDYTEAKSRKFIDSVIAANVTAIKDSGMLYKYAMASCDDLKISQEDCGSVGELIYLPISEDEYNFKVKHHFITTLDEYTEDYQDFVDKTKDLESVYIRTFSECQVGNRCFCSKCAGLFRRNKEETFVPKYIGLYATLMVTEKATQASLDSMNKGESESVNKILEEKIEGEYFPNDARDLIRELINRIGYESGVESRFYEIVLLSRYYEHLLEFAPLTTSFLRSRDYFGQFIYRPKQMLGNLINQGGCELTSTKSKIAFDNYEIDTE